MLEAVSIPVPEGAREGVVTLEPWRNPSHQELGLQRNTASARPFVRLPWGFRGSYHLISQPLHPPLSCRASHWVNQPETLGQVSSGGAENGFVGKGRQMEKPPTWRKEEVKEAKRQEKTAAKAAGYFLGKEEEGWGKNSSVKQRCFPGERDFSMF